MIFNTFQFIWLFPIVLAIYWASVKFCGARSRMLAKALLLAFSYGVYVQWSLTFGVILLAVTLCAYSGGLMVAKAHGKRGMEGWMWTSVSLTVAPLILYKYTNFILQTGASALSWIGIDQVAPRYEWAVPLGLSFYTFQAIGYIVDVYQKKIEAERNIVDFGIFIAFFPQILCGPISTAKELLPQIRQPRGFDYEYAVRGLRYLLWGMFLKVVIADRLGMYVDYVYANYEIYSGFTSLVAAVFYSLQIYGDFAGYSYMAIGAAYMLGFELIINFRRPYFAISVSGFWKRWNISLTRWLTTYIFIPLGGSRCGKIRNYGNILITFLVSGIWHGANWTFIFWGVLHGVAQCVEKFFGLNKRDSAGIVRWGRTMLTFAFVTLAWIYFRSPSIGFANDFIAHLSACGEFYSNTLVFGHLALALAVALPIEIIREYYPALFGKLFGVTVLRWTGYVLLAVMTISFGVLDASQFIYVQF